jgi:hypothetical protein
LGQAVIVMSCGRVGSRLMLTESREVSRNVFHVSIT